MNINTGKTAFSPACFVLSGLALCGNSLVAEPVGVRPNVVMVICDDLTRQAMSCYSGTMMPTPQLDRLSKEGARFKRCLVTNSICSPSRAVILTGKYSHLNGVIHNRIPFDGTQQTLPNLLQAAGYQTAVIGKWHLHSDPVGYDFWQVLPGQGSYWNSDFLTPSGKIRKEGYVTTVITDDAIAWLKSRRDSPSPFYLQIGHKAPHADWNPDQSYQHLFDDVSVPEPPSLHEDLSSRSPAVQRILNIVGEEMWKDQKAFARRHGGIPDSLSDEEQKSWVYQRYIKDYLRCVASVDENIGRLLNYLDESGLSENTLLIFTSDQGFFLGEHGLYDKRLMYEEALSTPLLVRYPGVIPAGQEIDELTLNLDFAETILDFAGVPVPSDMQGKSFRGLIDPSQPKTVWRDAVYYRYFDPMRKLPVHEGVRTERYKLIRFLSPGIQWELYDLKKDPKEMKNIYGQASPELIQTLVSRMKNFREEYAVPDDNSDLDYNMGPKIPSLR